MFFSNRLAHHLIWQPNCERCCVREVRMQCHATDDCNRNIRGGFMMFPNTHAVSKSKHLALATRKLADGD